MSLIRCHRQEYFTDVKFDMQAFRIAAPSGDGNLVAREALAVRSFTVQTKLGD